MINTYFLDRFKDTKHTILRRFAQSALSTKIDAPNYIGHCEDLGLPQVYGGQVMGQALSLRNKPSGNTICSFIPQPLHRAIPINPSIMMSKIFVMGKVLAHAAFVPCKPSSRFFISLHRIKSLSQD